MVADYVGLITKICEGLTPANHTVAIELASVPERIRGYGPVKLHHITVAKLGES